MGSNGGREKAIGYRDRRRFSCCMYMYMYLYCIGHYSENQCVTCMTTTCHVEDPIDVND